MELKLLLFLASFAVAQDRRPTISYITQPEIVTDIGGTVEMKCSVQYGEDYPVVWMKLDQVDRNNDLPITSGNLFIHFIFPCYIHFGLKILTFNSLDVLFFSYFHPFQ